jgi:hypothetical protein
LPAVKGRLFIYGTLNKFIMKKMITNLGRKYIHLKAEAVNKARTAGREEQQQNRLPAQHPNKYWASPLFFTLNSPTEKQ